VALGHEIGDIHRFIFGSPRHSVVKAEEPAEPSGAVPKTPASGDTLVRLGIPPSMAVVESSWPLSVSELIAPRGLRKFHRALGDQKPADVQAKQATQPPISPPNGPERLIFPTKLSRCADPRRSIGPVGIDGRGRLSKNGPKYLRWARIESAQMGRPFVALARIVQ
jgi:hypothetical protein